MNWKPSLVRCFALSFGLALVGCGSAVDTTNEMSSTTVPQSSELANATLVTLDLPGMT